MALLRGRALGYARAPVMATFSVLMGSTIAVIFLVMRSRGVGGDLAMVVIFAGIVGGSLAVLIGFLRHLR